MYPNKYIYECHNINHKEILICPLCYTNLCFKCHNNDIIFCRGCYDFICSWCIPYLPEYIKNVRKCPLCIKK